MAISLGIYPTFSDKPIWHRILYINHTCQVSVQVSEAVAFLGGNAPGASKTLGSSIRRSHRFLENYRFCCALKMDPTCQPDPTNFCNWGPSMSQYHCHHPVLNFQCQVSLLSATLCLSKCHDLSPGMACEPQPKAARIRFSC